MLATPLYTGQGLGNQLHCYVTTRCIALDKGYDFGVANPELFKGKDFMNLDFGKVIPKNLPYYVETSSDYDPFIFNIPDNYLIHGNLQGVKYFENHKDEIREWLKVEPLDMPDNICVINFRGGEYVGVKDFFLPQSYWDNAVADMLEVNPDMKFEVHTDDPETAQRFFPDFHCIRDIELNWRSIRYAKYLIISNSSFAFFPAWLNEDVKLVIAPKYWGRYNLGYWDLKQNENKCFSYRYYEMDYK